MSNFDTTARRFLDSTLAGYASLAVRLVLSFGARIILARLVLPAGHGVYELALRLVILASAIRDLGLPHQLMRDERRPYGTVLAFSVGMGLVTTLALFLLAPTLSFLEPELPGVLRLLSVWVLLDGLIIVPKTYFERQLRIGAIAGWEIVRSLLVAAVSVALAWLGYGVWSFVIADLVAAAVFALVIWSKAWKQMPLEVDLRLIPDLLRQSAYLFLIWAFFQVLTYVDIYIVQIFGNAAIVGYYSRAYMIAFLVRQILATRALMPALVAYRDDPERFAATLQVGTLFIMTLEVLAAYFLFFNAEKIVAILLGERWDAAIPLLKILCFVPLIEVFTDTGGEALKVRHEDRTWLTIVLLNLASLLGFGIFFSRRWGATGMAWANYLLFGNVIMAWRLSKIFAGRFARLLIDAGVVYLTPLPLFLLVGHYFAADSWSRLLASMAAASLSGVVLAARFYPTFRRFFTAAEVDEPLSR